MKGWFLVLTAVAFLLIPAKDAVSDNNESRLAFAARLQAQVNAVQSLGQSLYHPDYTDFYNTALSEQVELLNIFRTSNSLMRTVWEDLLIQAGQALLLLPVPQEN